MHAYTFVYMLIGYRASLILCLDIHLRCDDFSVIYVDGVFKANTTIHHKAYQLQVEDTANTIAVYCYNEAYSGGILYSGSNGLISDGNWRCSDNKESGWFNEDFYDRHWATAYVIGSNANNPGGFSKSEEILDDAKWISSTSNYRREKHGFYCRGSLGPVSAIVRCSDNGEINVDGVFAGKTNNRDEAWRGAFDSVPYLLSVKCRSTGGPGGGGIMAAVSTGAVTDRRWKCSNTFQKSWTDITFDDSGPQWSEAFVVASNARDNFGSVRDERFPGTANRIWSRADSVYVASTAYCRAILGIQLFVKTTPNTTAEIYIDGQKHRKEVQPNEQWVDIVSNTTQLIALHGSSSWSEQPAVVVSLSNDAGNGSSVEWKCTSKLYAGWEKLGFNDSDWSDPLDDLTIAGQTSGHAVWATDANTTLEIQETYCRGKLECNCTQLCQPEVIGHHLTIKCACYEGYTLVENETICEDVDECNSTSSPLCDHQCINIPGSYYCACDDGYKVDPEDESKCVDIDECKKSLDNCTDSEHCDNTDGGFQCIAEDGTTDGSVASSQPPSPSPSSSSSAPATKPGSTTTTTTTTTTAATTTTTAAQEDVATGSTEESPDASSSTTPKSDQLKGTKASLNPIAIVVPIIIGVLLIAVAVVVLYFVRRKKRRAMGGVQYTVSNPLVDSWSQHAQDSGIRYQDLADQ